MDKMTIEHTIESVTTAVVKGFPKSICKILAVSENYKEYNIVKNLEACKPIGYRHDTACSCVTWEILLHVSPEANMQYIQALVEAALHLYENKHNNIITIYAHEQIGGEINLSNYAVNTINNCNGLLVNYELTVVLKDMQQYKMPVINLEALNVD